MNSNRPTTIRPVIIGSFGPPALACIRSWGKQGFPVGMVCIRSEGEAIPRSRYLTDFATLPPEEIYKADGIQVVNEFLKKFRASGIICINEDIACWLNDNRQHIPSDVTIWLPPNDIIKDLLSKKKQIKVAREVGFNVLPTYLIDRDENILSSIKSDHFPLCLRPAEAGTVKPAFKAHLVYSPGELERYIASLQKIEKPIIAQPFMNLQNLVVHGARTTMRKTIGLQAFLVERKFEGVTLTISPTNLWSDLKDKCIEFTDRFNLTGSYHFEFLINQNDGTACFLEINNRLGGTTAKVYASGYDEPLLALQAYGIPGRNQKKISNVVVSSKQALLKYFYYILKGRLTPLDYPEEPNIVRMIKTIYAFLRYRDDVFSLRDIRGSFALYFGNVKGILSSK
jgi:predicted ATP-grasp superfamily ATP-dependent carboligase